MKRLKMRGPKMKRPKRTKPQMKRVKSPRRKYLLRTPFPKALKILIYRYATWHLT
jgi:hypothetical protein